MQKLKNLLRDKHGEMYLRACFLILIICMVFYLVYTFCLTIIMINGQRKSAMQVLDHYTQYNAIEIYDSIKMKVDDTDSLDASVYITDLCTAQDLTTEDDTYCVYNSHGEYTYVVSDVTMTYTEDQTTKIQVTYHLNVPIRFMGITTWVDVPLTIYSRLDPKFYQEGETTLKKYTVRHWQEGLDGEYVLYETQTLYASGSIVTPTQAQYPGFVTPVKITTTLLDGGQTVVDYKYKRESYTVSVTAGDGVSSVSGAGTYKFGEEVTLSVVLDSGYYVPFWEGTPAWLTNRYALVHKFMATEDVSLTVYSVADVGALNTLGALYEGSLQTVSTASKTGPKLTGYNYYASFTPAEDAASYINQHWQSLYLYFQYFVPVTDSTVCSLTNYETGTFGTTNYVVLYYGSDYAIVIPEGAAFIEVHCTSQATISQPAVGYAVS